MFQIALQRHDSAEKHILTYIAAKICAAGGVPETDYTVECHQVSARNATIRMGGCQSAGEDSAKSVFNALKKPDGQWEEYATKMGSKVYVSRDRNTQDIWKRSGTKQLGQFLRRRLGDDDRARFEIQQWRGLLLLGGLEIARVVVTANRKTEVKWWTSRITDIYNQCKEAHDQLDKWIEAKASGSATTYDEDTGQFTTRL